MSYLKLSITLLILFLLTACSTPTRQWVLQQNITHSPCYNSGRMLLPTGEGTQYFELELVHSPSGLRMYLNILVLEALPHENDPSRTCITIFFENDSLTAYPYILKGGQRLLFPADVTEYLITKLLNGQSFTITVGRRKLEVIPTEFRAGYSQLMKIPLSKE